MPQILPFLPTHKSQEDGATPTSSFPMTGARGRVGVVSGVWVKIRVRVIIGLGLETRLGLG